MTESAPVLRGRSRAVAPVTRETHDVELAYAQSIARATDCLPAAYKNNPGAVLLAKSWADAHELPILTAIQWVAFVNGRPVIDATAQRALAERHGYRVSVEDVSDQAATVSISRDGELVGRVTYSLEDAQRAGLAQKDNWRKNPAAMLVARATSTAIRWHAPGVLLGTLDPDEAVEPDPVAVLTTQDVPPAGPREPEPSAEPVEEIVEAEIVEAEIVEETPAAPAETADRPDPALKGRARGAVESVKARGKYRELSELLKAEGIPLTTSKWTPTQTARVLELAETMTHDAPQEA